MNIMSSSTRSEAMLDEALAKALFNDKSFARWFTGRTSFAAEDANCVFCRCNNPWSTVRLEMPNALTGELDTLVKQCETDVLAVYLTSDGRRLALHIENKLVSGSFTANQPELYRARKEQWKGRDKLGNYTDAATVLIAPAAFQAKNPERSAIFDRFISHEDIAQYLEEFR